MAVIGKFGLGIKMEELISVIVPVYNVEKYIKRCIDSIIQQEYRNLEIILVDDGSTDKSGIICDEYKKRDKRICVVHKENGGLSSARNIGIDLAKGNYIAFVDSDDYISVAMYSVLMKNIIEEKADISIINYQIVSEWEEIGQKVIGKSKRKVMSGREACKERYKKDGTVMVVAWNKLYKKELFQFVRYPIGKLHEDEFTTYKLLYSANIVVYQDKKLYAYVQRKSSIMGEFSRKRLDVLAAVRECREFWEKNKEKELYELSVEQYIFLLLNLYTNAKGVKNKDIRTSLYRQYQEIKWEILGRKRIAGKRKCQMFLFECNPFLYSIGIRIKKLLFAAWKK